MSDLVVWSGAWWKALVESALRQAAQVLVPALVAIQMASGRVDVGASVAVVAAAMALTFVHGVLRGLAGAGQSGVVGRAVAAGAGTLAGLVPLSAVECAGLGWGDWKAMVVASVASAGLAVCHWYVDPPRG